MTFLTGAEIVVKLLERQGVKFVSGIPGGSNLPLYHALAQSSQIRHVLARHEQGAGFIAEGIARSSAQVGVCFATSGPGATNILTALANAKLDSIPLVCITGQVNRNLLGTDAFQEVDTYGISAPITKHNFLVRSADELTTIIPKAFHLATSGRPGPVLIDLPKDVQQEKIEISEWPSPGMPDVPPSISLQKIKQAADLINNAKRPVLYLGGGTRTLQAAQLCEKLATKSNIPAVKTLMALDVLPTVHPMSLGILGMHAAPFTNVVLEYADLIIILGARLNDRTTGAISYFCPKAQIIHVDIDAAELGKNRIPEIDILGDVSVVLAELLPKIKAQKRSAWRQKVCEIRAQYPMQPIENAEVQSAYGAILITASIAGNDAIITTDVGQHQMRVAQVYPFAKSQQWLTSGGLGTMGFGLPAALGAALANPYRKVICFSGDGSLLMNMQEMATAAEEELCIKVILFDNKSLGLVGQQQDLFVGQRFATDYRTQVDFVAIAKGFGWQAYDLACETNPQQALKSAIQSAKPTLIRIPIAANEHVFPMVKPGSANTDMIMEMPNV
ncbi:MAG: biosynthetic-type acetolactate synthase large subunit [Deltaproteobacteria bacterium]|nr:biosynthetic-type acetolactate synthase large subunit [Deltaproteobacteria bacterium]